MRIWTIILLFVFLKASAQEVLVSSDINIRNDNFYEVLTNVNNRTVLFRYGSDDYFMETLDDDMRITSTSEITFEEPKVEIFNIVPFDTCFQIIYGYMKEDSVRIMSRRLHATEGMIDSTHLFSVKKRNFRKYKYVNSEDRSKTLLYARDRKDRLEFYSINNETQKSKPITTLELDYVDISNDFKEIVLTNNGHIILYFDKENSKFSRKEHVGYIVVIPPSGNRLHEIQVDYNEFLATDMFLSYDNRNDRLLLSGLYNEDGGPGILGYYIINKKLALLSKKETPNFVEFDNQFSSDINGARRRRGGQISDFIIRDIVSREDGGVILFFESYKELSRRSTYRFTRVYDDGLPGYTDYYNEDIILVNLDVEGNEDWKTVLHKKQFSQDDGAIYSSFYIFKTPSQLRLIYNDEISKSSTISEYLVNPLGEYERRAILNTESEELKLRFSAAQQISPYTLIIPSEKNYALNLVKISYQ